MSRTSSESSSKSEQPPKLRRAKPLQEALQINNRKQIYTSDNGQHAATDFTVSTIHFLKAALGMNWRKRSIDRKRKGRRTRGWIIEQKTLGRKRGGDYGL
jgi:hypothetical protein